MKNLSEPHDRVKMLRQVDTSQLPPDGGDQFNRLIFEKSPYLLQHAENPLDWHAWNDDTLDKARREDKPVFLSIGYSTCHWCHVMESESFEHDDVAAVVNPSFIPIKVDREERPDIDQIYMTACQLMTGSGGWPLTLILTPGLKPFFAATYLPKRSRGGMPGLMEILSKVAELWPENRDRLEATGDQAVAALRSLGESTNAAGEIDDRPLRLALRQYRGSFDSRFGGFGEAPKFPAPHNLSLLFRLGRRFGEPNATEMALKTLRAIRLGGIYDQVGFGLHRYSVDGQWLVPHFEKMLYDQALAALAFLEGFQVSGEPFYARTAEEIFTYVRRDLGDSEGGFFAGEDADSEGVEGRFYLWEPDQIVKLLGEDLGGRFNRFFGIIPAGHLDGGSIPHRSDHDFSVVDDRSPLDTLPDDMEKARQRLFEERENRIRPHRDEKVLAGWNGLMIGALARGGGVLNRSDLLQAAERAADTLLSRQRTDEGRLLRRWCAGEAAIPAFLEDYAFLVFGLLELFQAGLKQRHLTSALELNRQAESLFGDGDGGYYDTGRDAETVLTRCRSWQDGALPAGISMMVWNQLRLGRIAGDDRLTTMGERALRSSLGRIGSMPTAFSLFLSALDLSLAPATEISLLPGPEDRSGKELEQAFRRIFCPEAVIRSSPENAPQADPLADLSGKEGLLVCRDRTCLPPISDPDHLKEVLNSGFPVLS